MDTIDLNKLTLPDRGLALVPDAELTRLLAAAVEEDGVLRGDITTGSIVPEGRDVVADFVSRDPGVLAGMDLLVRASQLEPLAGRVRIEACAEDGQPIATGQTIGRLHGSWRDVLTFERTLLIVSHDRFFLDGVVDRVLEPRRVLCMTLVKKSNMFDETYNELFFNCVSNNKLYIKYAPEFWIPISLFNGINFSFF